MRVALLCVLFGILEGSSSWAGPPASEGKGPAVNPASVSLGLAIRSAVPGVQCQGEPPVQGDTGAVVMNVRPGSSADRAGIQVGDVVLRLGASDIHGFADLPVAMRSLHVGDRTVAVVRRNGKELTLPVQFTDADALTPPAGKAPQTSMLAAGVGAQCLPSLPYEVLPVPQKMGELADSLQGETSISASGDVLSILHRDARSDVSIMGSFQMPMSRIPGTDLWVLRLRMVGWDKAFFSYQFFSGQAPTRLPAPSSSGRYRGPAAPAIPEERVMLKGRLQHISLHSTHLGEERGVNVYLPPAPKRPLPALFMVDGQACEAFARVLEPLMEAGTIRPFAIVGVEAAPGLPVVQGGSLTLDRRSQEYLPGTAPDMFERHMRFFTEEVLPWATRTYQLSDKAADRALFGFSNGAAFVLAVAMRHPRLLGAVLPFSAGWKMFLTPPAGSLPRVFMAAGELEPAFLATTRKDYERLRDAGAEVTFESYLSGHDPLMWSVALVRYLPRIFPGR